MEETGWEKEGGTKRETKRLMQGGIERKKVVRKRNKEGMEMCGTKEKVQKGTEDETME